MVPVQPRTNHLQTANPKLQTFSMPARFHDDDVRSRLTDKRRLSTFLDGLVRQHRPGSRYVSLTCVFVSDEKLAGMNVEFLQHDTFTDIITFDLSETDAETVGELYISVDRVAENAQAFGVSYLHELHRVIFHGVLHLCGFGDKTPDEQAAMRTMEAQCLEAYFDVDS